MSFSVARRFYRALRAFRDRVHLSSVLPIGIAISAGLIVYMISIGVFPHHSSNHDEGVYLMQAAMFLHGQLELSAGQLVDAFRPWFFIQDGSRLYPKYAPVPAAFYALSIALFETPRVALGIIAAGNTYLVYRLGGLLGTRRIGIIAALVFAASPLSLITTAVFLPYALSTFLQLCFATAYLRSVRENSMFAASGAGIAIGLAFFARPFTAVLFTLPFIIHAIFQLFSYYRSTPPTYLHRHLITAVIGTGFVTLTLLYNFRMTGAPLVFPYEAFAPLDGPGFGERRLLSHAITYTPTLALEANGYVLWYFATRWFTAGPLGTLLALIGVLLSALFIRIDQPTLSVERLDRPATLLVMALIPSVILGNLFFWGNYNILATMTDPTDGLIARLGPFYHFDLLLPLSLFTAIAITTIWEYASGIDSVQSPFSRTQHRAIIYGGFTVFLLVAGISTALLLTAPLEKNYATTQHYENAYHPFEETSLQNTLVFLPTPYGDWQHHPFQSLRNAPDFNGPTVYALDRGPENFPVTDTYPNRSYYRYTYRGEWSAQPATPITPLLEPISIPTNQIHHAETQIDIPPRVTHALIRLNTDTSQPASAYRDTLTDRLVIPLRITPENATVAGSETQLTVPITTTDTVVLTITLVQPDGSTETYRQEIQVRTNQTHVDVIWPPDRYVCSLTLDCGNEDRYIPPENETTPPSFDTQLQSSN